MILDLKTLAEQLEIKDQRMIKLKKLIMTSLDNPPKMRKIIDSQRECQDQTHCYSCNYESDCLVINGIAHLNLDEIKTAIEYLEEANRQFRNQDDIWNQTISLALIGEAHEKNKKNYRALLEFEKAYNTNKLFLQIHSTEYPKNAMLLDEMLKVRIGMLLEKNQL
jgi:tetratricopeptide (TPR) repeat protein